MIYKKIVVPNGITKFIFLLWILCSITAHAEDAVYPELNDRDGFSVMETLANMGLHDLKDEQWNIYGQATYITSHKNSFHAAYTNLNGTPNSLLTNAERSFTGTVSIYVAFKGWTGAEFYASPEMISEKPLSGLKGIGAAIQNFELQKNGSVSPLWYRARAFYRQTISLGGTTSELASAPMQLAGTVDSHRLVFTGGNFSVLDIFDKNTYAGDLRHQFFNMSFMANSAYDFAADSRGYTTGMALEYYYDDWAFRLGRFAVPKSPNTLPLDFDLLHFYGDQFEIEHKHTLYGRQGAVRLLAYRNRLPNAGNFNDAIASYQADPTKNATTCTTTSYGSDNASAPDLCWSRKVNTKVGIGINIEQSISQDIGAFFRGMYSDGKTEVYNYTTADRSMSLGAIMKGLRWNREKDSIGIGYAQSWISKSHVAFLNMGGIDGFIGDGKINYKPEQVIDLYYQCHLFDSTWVSVDYQHLINPAYNADRGPVDIFGARAHFEF